MLTAWTADFIVFQLSCGKSVKQRFTEVFVFDYDLFTFFVFWSGGGGGGVVTFPLVALDIIFICLLVFGFGISGILLSWQRELSFFLFHGLNSPLSAIFLFKTIFVEEGVRFHLDLRAVCSITCCSYLLCNRCLQRLLTLKRRGQGTLQPFSGP